MPLALNKISEVLEVKILGIQKRNNIQYLGVHCDCVVEFHVLSVVNFLLARANQKNIN